MKTARAFIRHWFPGLAVVAYLVGGWHSPGLWEAVAAALLIVRLAAGDGAWLNKTSGRVALAMLLGSALLASRNGHWDAWFGGLDRYVGVVVLVLCVSFLRLPLQHIRIGGARQAGGRRSPVALIATASSAVSPLLNLGTIALLGGLLQTEGRQATSVSGAVTRGVGAALLVSPTFAPSAIVLSELPGVSWVSTLPVALPLFCSLLAMAWLCQSRQSVTWTAARSDGLPGFHLLLVIALMATLLVALRALADWSIVHSVSAAAVASVLLWRWVFARTGATPVSIRPRQHLSGFWPAIEAEAALFLASGALAGILAADPGFQAFAQSFVAAAADSPLLLFVTVLVGMPAVTALGIHPIVPFVILVHLIDAATLGLASAQMYVLWVSAWVLAMMVSPVSAINISAATFFRVSPWVLGLRENVPYAALFAAIALALFTTIGR